MTIQAQTDLHRFADWLRRSDDHAEHHLALLERLEFALLDIEHTSLEDRHVLAQKAARWRYQHLNEHAGNLQPQDEDLVDALDRSANALAGRDIRPSRNTRHAIHDITCETNSVRDAISLLHSDASLDDLACRATELTSVTFDAGEEKNSITAQRRMLLYAPLYVSSDCVNFCQYCGFRYPLDIVRRHLARPEVIKQARILKGHGFQHLLVVGGDYPSRTTTAYYRDLIETLVQLGITPAVEIAPQTVESYEELVAGGTCGVTLYQETYDEGLYAKYHVRGPKSFYHWRLEGLDRAAEAGVERLGLGILLGLADAREDLRRLMRHGAYVARRFPDCKLAFSLPRIHQAPDDFLVRHPVSDEELIRLYCTLRIGFPQAELVLSTREAVGLRNRLVKICITQMSAGSSTTPGGYELHAEATGEQFPVSDDRSPREVADWLRGERLAPKWTVG